MVVRYAEDASCFLSLVCVNCCRRDEVSVVSVACPVLGRRKERKEKEEKVNRDDVIRGDLYNGLDTRKEMQLIPKGREGKIIAMPLGGRGRGPGIRVGCRLSS